MGLLARNLCKAEERIRLDVPRTVRFLFERRGHLTEYRFLSMDTGILLQYGSVQWFYGITADILNITSSAGYNTHILYIIPNTVLLAL